MYSEMFLISLILSLIKNTIKNKLDNFDIFHIKRKNAQIVGICVISIGESARYVIQFLKNKYKSIYPHDQVYMSIVIILNNLNIYKYIIIYPT